MRRGATTVLVVSAAAAALVRWGDAGLASNAPRMSQTISAEPLAPREASQGEHRRLDQAWVAAAENALASPTTVELPYAEWGSFLGSEPSARAFAFAGAEGQVVKIALALPETQGLAVLVDGNLHVQLFLDAAGRGEYLHGDDHEHALLAEFQTSEPALWVRLPAAANYVVRLQPEPMTDTLYQLSVELEAALPFPVKGRSGDAVGSLFGMPRDAGSRHHEGIDIFAPRLTPVVAVADGSATPRENKLGGNTVWLSTPGTSYYYAHLERSIVSAGQRVRVGDVIGYVGNSGNAVTTDPHLHFGIYRWGKGAVDPFPLLQARAFAEPPAGRADSQFVQAPVRGACTSAPRVRNVAAFGCAMRLGAAVEGHSAAAAGGCVTRDSRDSRSPEVAASLVPSAVQWQTTALSGDDPSAMVAPVDFDPADAYDVSIAAGADEPQLACELASRADASSLRADIQQRLRVMAF